MNNPNTPKPVTITLSPEMAHHLAEIFTIAELSDYKIRSVSLEAFYRTVNDWLEIGRVFNEAGIKMPFGFVGAPPKVEDERYQLYINELYGALVSLIRDELLVVLKQDATSEVKKRVRLLSTHLTHLLNNPPAKDTIYPEYIDFTQYLYGAQVANDLNHAAALLANKQ